MGDVISRHTGAKAQSVIVGPKLGVDVSVLRIDRAKVMILSCDPVSFIPAIGPRASARMSVYEIASDVSTSGNPPKYAMVDLNLPPELSDRALTAYWESFHKTCAELGLSVVGGHTGRFEGCDYTVVGGATLWTFCGPNDYVTSMMAQDGDDIILTKGAAYGTTSILAQAFPKTVRKALGTYLYDKARRYFSTSNTVRDAVTAASVGIHDDGVTAMHDATEGGVVAAVLELAEASRLGGTLMLDEILVSDETRTLCRLFRIDPLVSLGEGCLVIASRPERTSRIIGTLGSKGVQAAMVGKLSSRTRGVRGITKSGRTPLKYPRKDPYWGAYWNAVRKGWS